MNQVLNFRISSGEKLELIKSFDIQVDRMQIAEPGTPITTIIIIIVIIVLITIILVIMATVYAKNNDKWCYQSSSRPYINPDISVRLHLTKKCLLCIIIVGTERTIASPTPSICQALCYLKRFIHTNISNKYQPFLTDSVNI